MRVNVNKAGRIKTYVITLTRNITNSEADFKIRSMFGLARTGYCYNVKDQFSPFSYDNTVNFDTDLDANSCMQDLINVFTSDTNFRPYARIQELIFGIGLLSYKNKNIKI